MSEIPLVEINSNLRILGTAHISSTSVAQVREQIETYQPDVVAVELCKSRYDSLVSGRRLDKEGLLKVIKEGKAPLVLLQSMLAAEQRKLGLDEGCSIDDDVKPRKTLTIKEFALRNIWGEIEEAAEYNGRPVKLNNPTRGDVKKYKVYVRNDKGNVVKVEFGDPNMEIKRDDPARRKSFRARHNCDNPGPKYKARFWSCKFWEKGKSVSDLMKG